MTYPNLSDAAERAHRLGDSFGAGDPANSPSIHSERVIAAFFGSFFSAVFLPIDYWLLLNLTERLPTQEQKFGFAVSAKHERKLYCLRGAGNRR